MELPPLKKLTHGDVGMRSKPLGPEEGSRYGSRVTVLRNPVDPFVPRETSCRLWLTESAPDDDGTDDTISEEDIDLPDTIDVTEAKMGASSGCSC